MNVSATHVQMIEITNIAALPQVRTMTGMDKGSITELAASLTTHGMLQPMILRANDDSHAKAKFVIVAGHRRFAAAQAAGFTHVPAIITTADQPQAMEMQLTENLQRENLNLSETAAAVRVLADMYGDASAVCKAVNKSKAWVSKHLALTSPRFSADVRQLLDARKCDDLETLLCLDQIAKHEAGKALASRLIAQAREATLTRTDARNALARLKEAAKDTDTDNEGDADAQDDDESGNKTKDRTFKVTLPSERLYKKFLDLGGEEWLARTIREAVVA